MSVTLRDVAKKIGLSVSTGSQAPNDYTDVNPETKEKIPRLAREMDSDRRSFGLARQKGQSVQGAVPQQDS
ncbi:MAG: LacI family DNA-binding transcriptional regulator [Anaerolineae bacterium]|nr:LacI family DNA-binding transcriptional regulator [Anaerolineae bacterium]NIN96364.1 LacI family DNA-binding transcriptional regulator [Anaerolineae bacterium]NIQ79399.1 LacI family DNA-binding transcriptional regulator [Anaerolineae bacterium]